LIFAEGFCGIFDFVEGYNVVEPPAVICRDFLRMYHVDWWARHIKRVKPEVVDDVWVRFFVLVNLKF
jgi:hypothetical protein